MTTGVDAQTCKVIVPTAISIHDRIQTDHRPWYTYQEDFGKLYFTIPDFRNVTDLFADRAFDGDPVRIKRSIRGEDISRH